ncbi:MAG TPA: cysteine desulfurase family protein [Candidatus Kapabacteria bacterium]|nr:cysteine desulfurase family protein [Candidatus Kapabacteria bacterium]
MIYLDNSATTPLAPEVLEAMQPYFLGEFGNASSVYTLGTRARARLEEAREIIARSIHAEPREIVFTSGGTESNNAAIQGAAFHHLLAGKAIADFQIITEKAEHHAVLQPTEFLQQLGAHVTYLDVDASGHVNPEDFDRVITDRTQLVSCMMVNNEVGAINPIQEITRRVKERTSTLVHTDAVQALGKIPVDVKELGVDLLSLSAHKIHGPKGIGALYIRSGVQLEPLLHGGAQERNRRGGTEAVALAIGFAEAIKQLPPAEIISRHFTALRKHLLDRLSQIPEVLLNSATDDTASAAIVSFSFVPEVLARLEAETLIIRFDLAGIAISNGSACTSGAMQPSHVLLGMGKDKEVASKSVRVSFSRYTSVEDIDRFVEVLRGFL